MMTIKRNKECWGARFYSKNDMTINEFIKDIETRLIKFLSHLHDGKHKFEFWYRLNWPLPDDKNTYGLFLSEYKDKEDLWNAFNDAFNNYIPDQSSDRLSNRKALPLFFLAGNSIVFFDDLLTGLLNKLPFAHSKDVFEITDRFLRHPELNDMSEGFVSQDSKGYTRPIERIAVLVPSFFGDPEQYYKGQGDWLLIGFKERIHQTTVERWLHVYKESRTAGTLKEWEENLYDYKIEQVLPDKEDMHIIENMRKKISSHKDLLVAIAESVVDHEDFKRKLANVRKSLKF